MNIKLSLFTIGYMFTLRKSDGVSWFIESDHLCLSSQAPSVMAFPATTPTGMMAYGMVSSLGGALSFQSHEAMPRNPFYI